MWLTAEQEVWLRDSLKLEPEWLQRMVLENFGVYEPDVFGRIPARAAMARFEAVLGAYEPIIPFNPRLLDKDA